MNVGVVGAGLAGLVAARDLVRNGHDVTVFDANPEPGGHARTTEEQGFAWEWGPHTVASTATAVHDLIDDLGLQDEVVRPAGPGTRYLFRGGQMRALPKGPLGLLRSKAMSKRGWLRMLGEPLVRSKAAPGESVHDFFARRVGREAAEILVGSFVSGIYAGDPRSLGAADAFPTLAAWERDHGSVVRGMLARPKGQRRTIVAFRRGTGTLPRALAATLGERLRTNTPVQALQGTTLSTAEGRETFDRVVLATPPNVAAGLLGAALPALNEIAAKSPMAPIAVVHLMGHGGTPPEGFGVLVPRSEGVRTLGILFVASQIPSRAPGGSWLLTCFIGGSLDPHAVDESDERLVDQAIGDVRRTTGFDARPQLTRVVRHPSAIPQLGPGHLARVAALQPPDGIVLAGNWTGGVSIDHAVRSGHAAAKAVG